MDSGRSLRTMIFVPGYLEKYLQKAVSFAADALILDLEDAVPDQFKAAARANIRRALEEGRYPQQVYIRVNPADSGMLLDDLEHTLHPATTGFMFTKVRDEHEIFYLDRLLTQLELKRGFAEGTFRMCPLIETGTAVLRAYEIAKASPRVTALAFGGEDYLTDLDGLHKEHGSSLLVPRSLIVIAARSAGVEAVDTPYLNIRNAAGFRREVELGRELGFSGILVIHPSQIEVANAVFSPSEEEVREAERIIACIEESRKEGLGVALLDGELIGPPMLKRAQNVMRKVARIRANTASWEVVGAPAAREVEAWASPRTG
jgi:citrate lyase subunit beta / citryl-CoA lyase